MVKWIIKLVLSQGLIEQSRSQVVVFQGKEKGTAINETTWKFLSPLNSSAGNLSAPVVAQKFPPFQCCFRWSNKVPQLLVPFRNYRLIIGRLRLAHYLPLLFCSHRKAWDNIYPDRLHVRAEGRHPRPPSLAGSRRVNQRGREPAVAHWVVRTAKEPPTVSLSSWFWMSRSRLRSSLRSNQKELNY